jgi:hypothetical protein
LRLRRLVSLVEAMLASVLHVPFTGIERGMSKFQLSERARAAGAVLAATAAVAVGGVALAGPAEAATWCSDDSRDRRICCDNDWCWYPAEKPGEVNQSYNNGRW